MFLHYPGEGWGQFAVLGQAAAEKCCSESKGAVIAVDLITNHTVYRSPGASWAK
jgi:hypothetical protein